MKLVAHLIHHEHQTKTHKAAANLTAELRLPDDLDASCSDDADSGDTAASDTSLSSGCCCCCSASVATGNGASMSTNPRGTSSTTTRLAAKRMQNLVARARLARSHAGAITPRA